MQKPIHITASMYAHGIARALPISPAATQPSAEAISGSQRHPAASSSGKQQRQAATSSQQQSAESRKSADHKQHLSQSHIALTLPGSQNATGQPCRKVFPGQPWETREPAAKEPAATLSSFQVEYNHATMGAVPQLSPGHVERPRDACAVLLAGAQLVAQGLCHQSQLLFHQSQLLFPLAPGLTLRVHGCHLFPLAATLGD